MSDTPYLYPFDPTGTKADNRIEGEQQVLSPPAWRDYHFFIPKLAPFFREGFTLYHPASNRFLVEGVDYLLTHRFYQASKAIMKPIYGSVLFFDKSLAGAVTLTYQTLGGNWTIDGVKINQILSQKQANPRITTWEQVAEVPEQFPVIDHEWDIQDMVGMSHVRDALEGLATTLEESGVSNSTLIAHINNTNNPHGTTKHHVDLGNVENYPPANRSQATGGTYDYAYMTPRRTRQAFEHFITDLLQEFETLETALWNRMRSLEDELDALRGNTYTKAEIDDMFAALTGPSEALDNHLNATNPHETNSSHLGVEDLADTTLMTVVEASQAASDRLSNSH